jgi:hypothetical protein
MSKMFSRLLATVLIVPVLYIYRQCVQAVQCACGAASYCQNQCRSVMRFSRNGTGIDYKRVVRFQTQKSFKEKNMIKKII